MKRFDERDVIFTRMSFSPEESRYKDYYSRNPSKKELDDSLRQPPHLLSQGTPGYEKLHSEIAEAAFLFLSDIKHLCEGKAQGSSTVHVDPSLMSKKVKGLAATYGACLCGVATMKEEFYYSHFGRNPEKYGEKITDLLPYGIVFAVEMDADQVSMAPHTPQTVEVTRAYVKAAVAGMIISYYIRNLGWSARNHMDGNYLVQTKSVASAAGLGQFGLSSNLITLEYGSRVRLGVVTTDIPLSVDCEKNWFIHDYCRNCGLCAELCPGKAICSDLNDGSGTGGCDMDKCFAFWKKMGTDCGLCVSVCPFSRGLSKDISFKRINDDKEISKILSDWMVRHGRKPEPVRKDWLSVEDLG